MIPTQSLHSLYTVQFYNAFANLRNSYIVFVGLKNKKAPNFSGLFLVSLMFLRLCYGTLERIRTSDLPLRRRIFRGVFPQLFQRLENQDKKIHSLYTVKDFAIILNRSKFFVKFQNFINYSRSSKGRVSSFVWPVSPSFVAQSNGGPMTSTS